MNEFNFTCVSCRCSIEQGNECGDDEPYCLRCFVTLVESKIMNEVPSNMWDTFMRELAVKMSWP